MIMLNTTVTELGNSWLSFHFSFLPHAVSINVHPESVFDTVAICLPITQLASETKNKDILYDMTSCIFN